MTSLKPGAAAARRTTILAAVVSAGLLLVGLGFTLPSLRKKAAVKAPEEDLAQESMNRPAIPPIDAAAPTGVKTATFALG